MENRKLDNQTLDAIGKKLIVSDAQRVVDVDAIVSNPRLFASVRARIAVVETPEPRVTWFTLTRFKVAAFSAATAVLLLVVGAFFSLLDAGRGVVAVNTIQNSPQVADVARPVFPPQGIESSKLSAGRASNFEKNTEKTTAVMSNLRTPRPLVAEPNAEFLAVAYTGDPQETAGGGRIIRVEMDRSALYALGIDLPLENGEDKIKADLLVGTDGVTRGVRIVR